MENGQLQTVDEKALLAEAREVWAKRRKDIPPVGLEGKSFLEAQERFQRQILAQPFVVDAY